LFGFYSISLDDLFFFIIMQVTRKQSNEKLSKMFIYSVDLVYLYLSLHLIVDRMMMMMMMMIVNFHDQIASK